MADTPELLKKSRKYFKDFLRAHKNEISQDVREYRTHPGSGYSPFYKSDEIIRIIRSIDAILDDQFRNLAIPGDFPSPKRLVETWQSFHKYLADQDELIKEVADKIIEEARRTYGKDFQHYFESGMILPLPFTGIVGVQRMVKDVLDHILNMDEVKKYLNPKEQENQPLDSKNIAFDIVIITALHETEFEALLNLPIQIEEHAEINDPTDYRKCKIGNTSVLLATDDTMGMAAAASLTTKLIAKYSPQYIIMSGIAGGVKDGIKHYGDIMVCRWSFNYESGKYKFNLQKEQSVFEPNPEQVEMSASLISKINRMKSNKKLLKEIADKFIESNNDKKPRSTLNVFVGPVASGSAVVADNRKIENIRAGNRKLIGIDMETFGLMYSARNFSNTQLTKVISIKSISDFADQRKNDKYRKYAAFTSANFIFELIKQELQNA